MMKGRVFTHRYFFRLGSMTLAVALVLGCATTGRGKTSSHPNILYIMSDDHAYQAISAYGGRLEDVIQTPDIDQLANLNYS